MIGTHGLIRTHKCQSTADQKMATTLNIIDLVNHSLSQDVCVYLELFDQIVCLDDWSVLPTSCNAHKIHIVCGKKQDGGSQLAEHLCGEAYPIRDARFF